MNMLLRAFQLALERHRAGQDCARLTRQGMEQDCNVQIKAAQLEGRKLTEDTSDTFSAVGYDVSFAKRHAVETSLPWKQVEVQSVLCN